MMRGQSGLFGVSPSSAKRKTFGLRAHQTRESLMVRPSDTGRLLQRALCVLENGHSAHPLVEPQRCVGCSITVASRHHLAAREAGKHRRTEMARYSRSAGKDVESAMRRRKKGTLKRGKHGHGGKVKSRKQAIAIGLSEARKKGKKVPRKSKSKSKNKSGRKRKSKRKSKS